MFFSLLQTLVCVLLVNTGLYALHLTGSASSSGGSGGNGGGGGGGGNNMGSGPNSGSSTQFSKPSAALNPFKSSTSNRLNEELADLAQLERERLMVMGLAKQTAEESIGYHGRPIITGRIKMHPAEDMDSEYSAWLSQQARNIMFGNVVKQPLNVEEDYDSGGDTGGFDILRPATTKYEYGRVVQPMDRERERDFVNPHNLDLDDFMELEPVNDMMEEDVFPDMDGYAYLEELMAEENKERMQQLQQQHQQHQHQQHHYAQAQQHQQQMPQFPGLRQTQTHHMPYSPSASSSALYQNHEPVDETKQAVQEFLEKEQKLQNLNHHQQQHQQQQQQQFNTKYRNNIRMQQKWLRKRNQQKEQLTRNIFGQKNAKALTQTLHQPVSLHHFKGLSSNKLAMANSEATATTRINGGGKQHEIAQQQKLNLHEKDINKNSSSASSSLSAAATSTAAVNNNNELKLELLQHPNHKRSGLTPASLASSAGVSSPHSLASQLMLRTARGQRQYDVPQIECPTAMDGMERFACPTPDVQGRYRCIDDHVLCDGFIDCPEGEDEDRRSCMFYKTTKAHLDVLADALLRWARGR